MLAIVVLALGVACSPDDPVAALTNAATVSPSPSPAPSLDPAEAAKQANIEAAKALVVEYQHVWTEIGQGRFQDWEAASRFWGNAQIAESETAFLEALKDGGYYTTGERRVANQTVTEYDPTPGFESVRLDTCIDYSGRQFFEASGAEMAGDPGRSNRTITQYQVTHLEGGTWVIAELDDTATAC